MVNIQKVSDYIASINPRLINLKVTGLEDNAVCVSFGVSAIVVKDLPSFNLKDLVKMGEEFMDDNIAIMVGLRWDIILMIKVNNPKYYYD